MKRGRPKGTGHQLTEVKLTIRGPALLVRAVEQAAQKEGISTNEWVRRSMREKIERADLQRK
jgi:predicted HicB family RNase H-like nuclease